MDKAELMFLVAGLVGGGLKAWLSGSQETLSKKSLGDVVVAGLVGLLWPLIGPIPLPKEATLLQQAGMITLICYAASHVVTSVLAKFGAPLDPGKP